MFANPLRDALDAGHAAVGVLAPQADPVLAETIALLGFDFFLVDAEHGPAGPAALLPVVLACERRGIAPLARLGTADPKALLQALDLGVAGVMMPGMTSADDVRRLVAAARYPPAGERGLGPVRAADYFLGETPQAKYVAEANRRVLLLPQIEDAACLDDLDEMTAVEGVDGFVIGPRDLALSMGFPDGPAHPEVREAIAQIRDAVLARGLVLGTVAGTGEAARALLDDGYRFILTSVQALLAGAARPFLHAARAAAEPA